MRKILVLTGCSGFLSTVVWHYWKCLWICVLLGDGDLLQPSSRECEVFILVLKTLPCLSHSWCVANIRIVRAAIQVSEHSFLFTEKILWSFHLIELLLKIWSSNEVLIGDSPYFNIKPSRMRYKTSLKYTCGPRTGKLYCACWITWPVTFVQLKVPFWCSVSRTRIRLW